MSVKIIFYELNQEETSPQYKELVKYLMGLEDWIQPLSSVWIVDTAKSAQVIRDEAKPLLPDTDKLFVAEWYPGGGWSSRNLPNVAAEWIHMHEGEQNIDQYKLPPSMVPPKDPNYIPPPPPEPSQEFLEARGIIEPEGTEGNPTDVPTPQQPLQTAEAPASESEIPGSIPAPSTTITPEAAADNSGTLSVQHDSPSPQSVEEPAATNNNPSEEPPANPTTQS